MALRYYQQDCVDRILADINDPRAIIAVLPTASGKSHIIAATAQMLQPVLVLQPSKELLEQNFDKLAQIVDPSEMGIYSASFNSKEIKRFTFATIQSVYKYPEKFQHIKLVIIDECHGVAVRSLGSMYTSFFKAIGSPKIVGLTATPYRLEVSYYWNDMGELEAATMLKLINRTRHKDAKEMFWKKIIYKIDYKELLEKGYLSPIKYIHEPLLPYEEIPINKSHSDYDLDSYVENIIGQEARILSTISEAQKRYKSLLVFCSNTDQCVKLSSVIKGSAVVLGSTKKKEREDIIRKFKSGEIQTVFNYGTLTTGFDKPDLDCVILLRPTRSLPLYNQMIGRLSRVAPGKEFGTVIDLTGTCKQMGGIESFQLYLNDRRLVDLRTEKCESWHDKVLFIRAVDNKPKEI